MAQLLGHLGVVRSPAAAAAAAAGAGAGAAASRHTPAAGPALRTAPHPAAWAGGGGGGQRRSRRVHASGCDVLIAASRVSASLSLCLTLSLTLSHYLLLCLTLSLSLSVSLIVSLVHGAERPAHCNVQRLAPTTRALPRWPCRPPPAAMRLVTALHSLHRPRHRRAGGSAALPSH